VALNAGGSGLSVGVVPQATCLACDSAPAVPLPGRHRGDGDISFRSDLVTGLMPEFKFFVFCEDKGFLSSLTKVVCECEGVPGVIDAVATKCELAQTSFDLEYFDKDVKDWVKLINDDEFSELDLSGAKQRLRLIQKREAQSR
jgi:hypothetical protein